MTLKIKIVSTRVRTAAWCSTHRKPSTRSRRALPRTPGTSRPWAGSTTLDTSSTPAATRTSWVANGHTTPAANRPAPIDGPTSWLSVMNPACRRELATARSSRPTSMGVRVVAVLSAKTSALASSPSATSAPATVTASATTRAVSTASTAARTESAVITIRRRSYRSAASPATRPNTSGGAHRIMAASAIGTGSWVSEAISSGPAAAATPSPKFVDHEDARSHRKPVPRRRGTRISAVRLTRRGPYGHRPPGRTRLSAGMVHR